MRDPGATMIDAAETGVIEWEDIARTAIEQMNSDELESVADALGFNEEDAVEENEDEDWYPEEVDE
jgi:hypothetical protein